MEDNAADHENLPADQPNNSARNENARMFLIAFIALVIAVFHGSYVSYLFEKERNFSMLSELEREMSLRFEMGFYYSYYKTMVEERPYLMALSKLMSDKQVEYPDEVNAFNRFNIHPEVILGSLYRYMEPYLNKTRKCQMIHRGENVTPVESCVGLGEPILFYMNAVWIFAGATAAIIFVFATTLSNSIFGGLFAFFQYMANHKNCTRVMWAPNERETFAQPLLLLQMWLVTIQLRRISQRKATLGIQIALLLINCFCILFWQFTQFIFFTQLFILLVMEQLKIIELKTLSIFLHSHFCGLHMAILLLQGNDMLKASAYSSFFIFITGYALVFGKMRVNIRSRFDLVMEGVFSFSRICVMVTGALCLRRIIADFLHYFDDAHVYQILYSKFSNYRSFHTMLYICSNVFGFLPLTTWSELWFSTLLPVTLFACVSFLIYWIKRTQRLMEEFNNDKDLKKEERFKDPLLLFFKLIDFEPGNFYNICQMVIFGVAATLVMRLKLLFVPHMCLVSAIIMNIDISKKRSMQFLLRNVFMPIVFLNLIWSTGNMMIEEASYVGEFSDLPQEELLNWINTNTSKDAVFAGPMPITTSVLLSTRRNIVNQPQYEHTESRNRNYHVYKVYGKFPAKAVYEVFSALKVTHLIMDKKYCYGKTSMGCTFEQIWDVERPDMKDKKLLCKTLLEETVEHFYKVFQNQRYVVFTVHDYSVRYMPRVLAT